MRSGSRYIATRLDGVTLYRSGRRVLTRIRWMIRPGQRWILMGPNGSGKTQLLKVIAGIVRPAPSSPPALHWRLDDEWHPVPYEIKRYVAYVGPERQDKYQRYAWNMAAEDVIGTGIHGTDVPLDMLNGVERRRVRMMLERLGITHLARRGFLELSYGERRMTLLARALIAQPKLLVLDEVFTGLDAENYARLMRWLTRLGGSLPVVMATHQTDDIPPSATHLLVLRQSRVVYSGPIRRSLLAVHVRGEEESRHAVRDWHAPRGQEVRRKRTLVRMSHAHVFLEEHRVLRDVSLSIGGGEWWVVHGANGAGKTTLLRTLYGDHGIAAGGSIGRIGIRLGVPLERFRERTGISAPHLHARFPRTCTVYEVVLSGCHGSVGLHRTPKKAEHDATLRVLRRLNLSKWVQRPLGELSYGQTRLVLFARAIVRAPRLLLLDEPCDSMDAAMRNVVTEQTVELSAQGIAVVVTAHCSSEWKTYATHELELTSGRVRYCGSLRSSPLPLESARRQQRDLASI
jgi:molybdate transport system ATP-binding protein